MDPVEQVPPLPMETGSGPHQEFLSALITALMRTLVRHAMRLNSMMPKDGTESMTAPLPLAAYTTATRPPAASWAGGVIYVSDGAPGSVIQASNGAAWVSLG